MSRRTWTRQEFERAVANETSIAGVLRELGLTPAGGNYTTVNHFVDEYDLDTSHWKGQGWSAGRKFQPKRQLSEYLVKGRRCQYNRLRKRLVSEGVKERRCEWCGLDTWNDKPIPLELDHIDGDRYNNLLENLRILCPNCHAQTDTYRGKNIKG